MRALGVLMALLLAVTAHASTELQRPADRVVAALSQNRVAITAGFEGLELLVFGAIARGDPLDNEEIGVVVTVVGPSRPVVVRRRSRVAGMWINTDAVTIAQAPSFYAVASTGPLEETISFTENLRHRVSLEHALRHVEGPETEAPRESFLEAVVRLRREQGLYVLQPGGVSLEEGVLFRTTIPLPSNIVEGTYTTQVLLTRDRAVIDVALSEIEVGKAGIEGFLYELANSAPFVYGVFSIAVALVAGYAASEVFRYLRR